MKEVMRILIDYLRNFLNVLNFFKKNLSIILTFLFIILSFLVLKQQADTINNLQEDIIILHIINENCILRHEIEIQNITNVMTHKLDSLIHYQKEVLEGLK